MTKDPVCGMQVDENKAPATSAYQGKKYSFCGQECKNKFDREPQRYAGQQAKQHEPQEHANR
jgi:YHS domain-containing protein